MNLIQRVKSAFTINRTIPLTESERSIIYKYFGSFDANQFALKGTDIITNSYEKNVDVYSIIKKISDIIKATPIIIEQRLGNGTYKEVKDSSLHSLIETPNKAKGYTWDDIEEQILIYLLCSGNSYIHGIRGFESKITEIDILPSHAVCIESNDDFFSPVVKYKFTIGTKAYNSLKTEDISHIKFFNPSYSTVTDSFYGLSPIQVAAKVVQTSNDRWDADAALLQNRGAIGLITDKSNRPMLPEEAERVQSDFNRQTAGTRNYGKIKVTNKDLSYIQMAMTSTDLQLLEKGVVNLRSLCNVFGIDSSLFNDPENKTYNNRKEAEKAMYTNAIMPLANKVSESLTSFLCKSHFPNGNVRMRYNFDGVEVLQDNFKDEAETFVMLKNAGIITAQAAAKELGIDDKDVPQQEPIQLENGQNI